LLVVAALETLPREIDGFVESEVDRALISALAFPSHNVSQDGDHNLGMKLDNESYDTMKHTLDAGWYCEDRDVGASKHETTVTEMELLGPLPPSRSLATSQCWRCLSQGLPFSRIEIDVEK
jgi:hypothetical protein